jgi:tRNA (guanine37-N1)-methyltransferase
MRFDVVTLFPELFEAFLSTSIVGRAVLSRTLRVRLKSPRDFGIGRHRNVDDTPYGGGSGMVMRVDCIVHCLEALDAAAAAEAGPIPTIDPDAPTAIIESGDPVEPEGDEADPEGEATEAPRPLPARAHRVLLTPQGAPLTQRRVMALAERPRVALVCGRYEGFDERVSEFVDEELSLGDFVLTGGEVAAMAVIDACARLLPGVLGNAASSEHESHSPSMGGLLEYPQYTRPVEFRSLRVPDVLQGGNHAAIEAYRRAESERRTQDRRPDLWAAYQADRSGNR